MRDHPEIVGLTLAIKGSMANRVTWAEMLTVMTEAEVQDRDAITLESYRWQLLEASARLSTTRLIIDQPTPVLDATDAALLHPLDAPAGDPLGRLIADLGAAPTRRQGRRTR